MADEHRGNLGKPHAGQQQRLTVMAMDNFRRCLQGRQAIDDRYRSAAELLRQRARLRRENSRLMTAGQQFQRELEDIQLRAGPLCETIVGDQDSHGAYRLRADPQTGSTIDSAVGYVY